MVRVAGLDPSGSERRRSGLAILDDNDLIYLNMPRSDSDIVEAVLSYMPAVIAIDSPLSYAERYREVDLLMKRLSYRVLPPGWKGMRKLVERSISLKRVFEGRGVAVIETHPRSALKSSGCRDFEELLSKHGIALNRAASRDEYDALVAALVAKHYVSGSALKVEARDGAIYLLPRVCT